MKRTLLAVAVLVVILLVFFTEEGYRAEFCPVCGEKTVESGLRTLGPKLTRVDQAPPSCLLDDHRFILSGAAWSFWWKDGYTHSTGIAWNWSYLYRDALGPWLRSRAPGDPARQRVLETLQRASPDQIVKLLGKENALAWRDAALLREPGDPAVLEAWAEEVLLPWVERVGPR